MNRGALALAVTAFIAFASHASATLVTWEFEAVVRGTDGPAPSWPHQNTFFVGQVFSGSLTFDTEAPPLSGSFFDDPVVSLHLAYPALALPYQVGPFVFTSGAPSGSTAFVFSGPGDRLSFFTTLATPTLGISGVSLQMVGLGLADFLPASGFPTAPPALSQLAPFDPAWASIALLRTGLFFQSPDGLYEVGAELTSLRAVPEPAAGALALVAFAALACFRRGSRGSIAA